MTVTTTKNRWRWYGFSLGNSKPVRRQTENPNGTYGGRFSKGSGLQKKLTLKNFFQNQPQHRQDSSSSPKTSRSNPLLPSRRPRDRGFTPSALGRRPGFWPVKIRFVTILNNVFYFAFLLSLLRYVIACRNKYTRCYNNFTKRSEIYFFTVVITEELAASCYTVYHLLTYPQCLIK